MKSKEKQRKNDIMYISTCINRNFYVYNTIALAKHYYSWKHKIQTNIPYGYILIFSFLGVEFIGRDYCVYKKNMYIMIFRTCVLNHLISECIF